MVKHVLRVLYVVCIVAITRGDRPVLAQHVPTILPEQRSIRVRAPARLPPVAIPAGDRPPPVVSQLDENVPVERVYLDDLIRESLNNTRVVRILSATGAASSGQTIYDPAIANARIDEPQARFDPTFEMRHNFQREENPFAIRLTPINGPVQTFLGGGRLDGYDTSMTLAKQSLSGALTDLTVFANRNRDDGLALNPESRSTVDVGITQPILRGAGADVNRVPIVLARIDAETSYFQLKDGMQEMVRGVIQGYWDVVSARTNIWAIEQQVEQSSFAVRLEETRNAVGDSDQAQLAQTRLALSNFRANLIAARSDLLDREAALRGILGLPPTADDQLVPMSAPVTSRLEFDWEGLITLAERQRPDLVELKLVLEADYQQLLFARNGTLPSLDAFARYRWNGLEGETAAGQVIRAESGQFTGWRLGVNFNVPVGLRESRAMLRQQELIIARDRENIDQRMLEITHELASTLRRIDRDFSQYEAFRETRLAAFANLRQQNVAFRAGRIEFINVLQGLTDWGNAISSEARALTQYNANLALLERQTGTILESHGIRFYEERYGSIGPLGICGHGRSYPEAMRQSGNVDRYPASDAPVDQQFRSDAPADLLRKKSPAHQNETLPPPLPPRR